MFFKKKKDEKILKKLRKATHKMSDAELRLAKHELENELLSTKRRSKLISLEKQIEAIEDAQAARGIFGAAVKKAEKGSKKAVRKLAKAARREEKKVAKRLKKEEKKAASKIEKEEKKEASRIRKEEKRAARLVRKEEKKEARRMKKED